MSDQQPGTQTQRRWLAFDLEIAALIPDEETDWEKHRPLGITCAALAWKVDIDDGIEAIAYSGVPRMTKSQCQNLVERLMRAISAGHTLLTWNGCAFDFDILAEESGMHDACAELAMNHVDMMVHIHALKGYPLGLDAVSKGVGLAGKMEGVSGAKAPYLWADGQYGTVLEYVKQDARSTLEVALKIEQQGYLQWTARSGRHNRLVIPQWLTVKECLALPLPDTNWMQNPLPRERFTSWMAKEAAQ